MQSNRGSKADMEARLQALCDRAEITDVIHRYGRGVATGDVELVASCFTGDAVLDMEYTVLNGGAAIRHFYAGRFGAAKDVPPAPVVLANKISTPVMANIEIELQGDTARCESTCLAIHAGDRDGKGMVVVRGTQNSDEFIYAGAGWKIRRRLHASKWVSESPGQVKKH